MTSKLPSRLKLGRDQTPIASERLLTEVLRDAGWHTALFANVTVFSFAVCGRGRALPIMIRVILPCTAQSLAPLI